MRGMTATKAVKKGKDSIIGHFREVLIVTVLIQKTKVGLAKRIYFGMRG